MFITRSLKKLYKHVINIILTNSVTAITMGASTSNDVGSVKSYDNINFRFTGTNNVGTVADNANLILYAIASSLNIVDNQNCNLNFEESNAKVVDNQNCKFNIKESRIKAVDNQNMRLDGKKNELTLVDNQNVQIFGDLNKLTLEDNQNTKVEGTLNEGTIKSNTNFGYKGNNGKFSYYGNTNTKINGNNNVVTASNNRNLKVESDDHQLTISDTSNHVLKAVSDTIRENIVQIKPLQLDSAIYKNNDDRGIVFSNNFFQMGSGAIVVNGNTVNVGSGISGMTCTTQGSNVFCSSNGHKLESNQQSGISATYLIDYVQKATISGNEYNLGIFKFKMERKDEQIQVIFVNSNLDSNSFHVIHASIEKYTISGCKDGKKEMLSIIGPAVTTEQDNLLLIDLTSS